MAPEEHVQYSRIWGPPSTHCVDQPQQPLHQSRRRESPARQGRRGSPGETCAPWCWLQGGGPHVQRMELWPGRGVPQVMLGVSGVLSAPAKPCSSLLNPTMTLRALQALPGCTEPIPNPSQADEFGSCRGQPSHLRTEQRRQAGQAPAGLCVGW